MPETTEEKVMNFSNLRKKLYKFLIDESNASELQVKEHFFEKSVGTFVSEEDYYNCVESLIKDGYVKVYYPNGSSVGHYHVAS